MSLLITPLCSSLPQPDSEKARTEAEAAATALRTLLFICGNQPPGQAASFRPTWRKANSLPLLGVKSRTRNVMATVLRVEQVAKVW
ncbi:hypothetical protein HW130_28005 [Streptomyces sp. PKU-EA00015]|uniref:hypothetical protein n=1 Tax=Streptomyces sp. PKU-EA00015 TaxID=2748326 RepID=UPI0015A0858A|nr:hypothetical protein [Streptomyces sp. PKU-EA00015]NWF30056.1 hypothetical protein [Streptomyces sp. PKU-EA00015]